MNSQVEFYIEVNDPDATEEELERSTRQLLSALKSINIDSAELVYGGSSPLGTKSGEALTIGTILISSLPDLLPAVIATVQTWTANSHGRTVKFKGEGIEFEGTSEELNQILSILKKRQGRK